MTPHVGTTARHHRKLALLLAALSALGPFSTDTYLPSLVDIGRELGATPALVQQTLTAYMVPFAAMTLWQGAISDALGRRRVTLAMLGAFTVASLGCIFAWDIQSLMAFRALQGMSAGAGMVIGRAVVRDVLDGAEARRLMAHVSLIFAIAPAGGPIIGGWLHVWFGWRSVFVFLTLFAAVLWWSCWRALPETLDPRHRQPLRPSHLLRSYGKVLRTAPFVALVVGVTLNFSAIFLYIMSAPAFVMGHLHLSETDFAWLFVPITLGMIAGTRLSAFAASRLSNSRTVAYALAIMGTSAVTNVLLSALVPPSVPWSVLPLALYVVGSSMAMPSLTLMALDLFPTQRGLASSCQAFVQSSGNALVTAVLAPLLWGAPITLALGQLALLTLGALGFLAYRLTLRRLPTPDPGH